MEDSRSGESPRPIDQETLNQIREMMRGSQPLNPPPSSGVSGDRIALAITVLVFLGSLGAGWASTASRITTIEERQRSGKYSSDRDRDAALVRFDRIEEKMGEHTKGGHPISMKAAVDAVALQLEDVKRRVERLEEK